MKRYYSFIKLMINSPDRKLESSDRRELLRIDIQQTVTKINKFKSKISHQSKTKAKSIHLHITMRPNLEMIALIKTHLETQIF